MGYIEKLNFMHPVDGKRHIIRKEDLFCLVIIIGMNVILGFKLIYDFDSYKDMQRNNQVFSYNIKSKIHNIQDRKNKFYFLNKFEMLTEYMNSNLLQFNSIEGENNQFQIEFPYISKNQYENIINSIEKKNNLFKIIDLTPVVENNGTYSFIVKVEVK